MPGNSQVCDDKLLTIKMLKHTRSSLKKCWNRYFLCCSSLRLLGFEIDRQRDAEGKVLGLQVAIDGNE